MTSMPTWEEFMIFSLRVMLDGEVRHVREIRNLVADEARLTDEQRMEVLLSGRQLLYENRIGWGLSFLANVGALKRPRRAYYEITPAGRQIVEDFPNGVTENQLRELGADESSPIREYVATVEPKAEKSREEALPEPHEVTLTPIEQVQTGVERIRTEVSVELLQRIQSMDPSVFEQVVVDLLIAMGYGGTTGAGKVTQRSNDGGIDGVIDQDILGVNRVYLQAKRYKTGNGVGRPELQAFVGALSGVADSGVFITSSHFSESAITYARNVPTRIILIDGKRLTNLMLRFGVGVQVRERYEIVEIDEDFFA